MEVDCFRLFWLAQRAITNCLHALLLLYYDHLLEEDFVFSGTQEISKGEKYISGMRKAQLLVRDAPELAQQGLWVMHHVHAGRAYSGLSLVLCCLPLSPAPSFCSNDSPYICCLNQQQQAFLE